MKLKILLAAAIITVFSLVGIQAQALMLTPLTPGDADAMGTVPANPDVSDMETLTGVSPLELLYKDNVGGSEEGSFAAYYQTTYFNTPSDPEDAWIEFVGSPGSQIICSDCFLLVKGGAGIAKDNAETEAEIGYIWYLFDISGWDGKEKIELEDFWPGQSAISHVQIAGKETPSVPEPAMLLLLGTCLIGLAGVRVIRKR